ncbi:hypothetical protein [Inquilinus limosus]|uniref:Uncharacterized protein n=1 Tax=Inquilinus limosus MP06 TaxID=1398085 RepID=A0A0A0DC64_9PROT|nr:hypothetical protein [Inquilinus limosus]KGM35704.1 hypothetical protein P409_02985 [Inquilinus limosus MP06]
MPRDASGTYTKPAGTTAVTGQVISSSAYNNLANDEAAALTDSLSRSGKGGMQADLNMGGKKVTNVAAGTADADAVRRDQLVAIAYNGAGGTTAGSGSAYTLSPDPPIPSYLTGRTYAFIAHATSTTTSPTLSVSAKGPKAIRLQGNALLPVGYIVAGSPYLAVDLGSTFQIISLNTVLGEAAVRNVGTSQSNLVEVSDTSGNLNAALNVANKQLSNLTTSGTPRIVWASVAFSGGGSLLAAFNGAAVTRNGVGLYTITFPSISGDYFVAIEMDVPVTSSGNNANVVSGSRTSTSVQISTMSGNSSMGAFDPDRVSVSIFRIG